MGMTNSQLNHLDGIAQDVRSGNDKRVGALSTGEQVYVALAGNNAKLLNDLGYTIAEALGRLGTSDVLSLIERWQYRG